MNEQKTFYGVYLDCLGGTCVFATREEAEEFRKMEIDGSDEPMSDDEISEVHEVKMTQEEFDNRPEV